VTVCAGAAKVIKTVGGMPPSGIQSFTFQLRQGASATSDGTVVESGVANATDGGVINFATALVPGTTYNLCEVMIPFWLTNLPNPYTIPNASGSDPTILCINFTAVAGQTSVFNVNNTQPGSVPFTIGYWKNWASCAGSNGKQSPVLDQTLFKAPNVTVPPSATAYPSIVLAATSGTYYVFGSTYYLVLQDTSTTQKSASDCQAAVNLLGKSTIKNGTKMSSDPAFNLAAQLLGAELNYIAGAKQSATVTNEINQAVLLLGKYQFNGNTHTTISAADVTTMNNLATALNNYNNNIM
jgi:hypothetical protein